ncbi:MAG: response regulator [Clostridium sp.]|nr:response regulator [Bacteroides sp.]MCM1197354.1 response regulator [Clostridium sp.]
MDLRRTLLFLAAFFESVLLYSGPVSDIPDLRFVPVPSGLLPTAEVRMLFQDSDGLIWLPTYNGLARFDGYDVVTYGLDSGNGVLFNSWLNAVAEDPDGMLWIAGRKGVFTLDKKTGLTGHVPGDMLPEIDSRDIICTRSGDIWVGGDRGVFRKRRGSAAFENICQEGLDIVGVSALMEDREGYIWVAACENGFYRYDPSTGRFLSYTDPVLRYADALFEDRDGYIWIGTWDRGLLRMDHNGDGGLEYLLFTHDSSEPESLLDNIVYDINQDPDGHIWVSSRSGLSILCGVPDGIGKACFRNYVPGTGAWELPYNEVSSILRTQDGTMWLSMFCGGVCRVEAAEKNFTVDHLGGVREKYHTNSVRSIFHAGGSRYWLGLIGYGMIFYDASDGSAVDYLNVPGFEGMPYTSSVDVIMRRRSTGEICFGTYSQGIWFYDEAGHRVRTEDSNALVYAGVTAIMEDRDSNLWVATSHGLYVLDISGNVWPLGEYMPCAAGVLDNAGPVIAISGDNDGNIWIASTYGGIVRISSRTEECRSYSVGKGHDSKNISCLYVDSHGWVWAGSMYSGLSCYNPVSDEFETITSLSVIDGRGISNIIEDSSGRIWMTTSDIAISFVPEDAPGKMGSLNFYSVAELGEVFSFNANSAAVMPDGRLMIGSSRGIVTFSVDDVPPVSMPSRLVFTDFRINGVSLRTIPRTERERISIDDVEYSGRIVLSHLDNSFTVGFSLMNYVNPEGNIYTYRLEGYDREDIVLAAGLHSAEYHNLPPGKYMLRLKGQDMYGNYSEERTLKIRILPSPWLSWWAITVYAVILGWMLYAFVWFLIYRMRMLQEIRIEKMEKAKIEELNSLKLKFFTNVTHELMTPLSIIMASVENLYVSGQDGIRKILPVISVNTTRLMRLIQQVLEFRKMESGNLKLTVSHDNLSAFVNGCVDAFVPLVANHSQNISFSSVPGEIWGWFDPDKVDKIVYNLLSNATKYTPDDGCISVALFQGHDGRGVIEVANTGSLMDEKTMAGLFERFYDGDYRRYNTIGTGIGLALVKDLAGLHKGTVSVTSDAENGNCFKVCIPLDREAFSQEEIDETINGNSLPSFVLPVPDSMEISSSAGSGNGYTLLIVDDNEELCMLLDNLLSAYFNIVTAESGEAAMEILSESGSIDLVVSDVMMPGMDGIELCRTIKGKMEWCHIPVVLLTAKRAEKDQVEGWNSGADGYVSKPCSFPVLYAQVMNCLRRRERRGTDFRRQLVFDVAALQYTPMDESFIQKAVDVVNANFRDYDFDLPKFTDAMGVSKTVLTDKLKSLTGLTPAAFIQNVRLTAAGRLLGEQADIRINDLAWSVGFNDPKYFSTCFKKKFGMTPKEFIAASRK